MHFSRIRSALLTFTALFISLPVLALLGSWLEWDATSAQVLGEMAQTVLPDYVLTSLLLCAGVAIGVTVLGLSTAVAVTTFKFPGQSFFEWALLLPMAMPAYVVAYAYTDFFQFSGPFQNFIRSAMSFEGRVFPEIRSLGGAVLIFSLTLYPYVYLLARTALSDRASHLMEAARLLGAPVSRRLLEIAVPLARPAVAAGVALVLMETLADFGVSSYFGIQTFTAGIYKAWLIMDNQVAAAQLATLLLLVVAVLLHFEKLAQARLRFSSILNSHTHSPESRLQVLSLHHGWLVCIACGGLVFLGFALPIFLMFKPLIFSEDLIPWNRFIDWSLNSLQLGLITALLAVGLSLLIAFGLRAKATPYNRLMSQMVGLGYAIPGAVVVVGMLIPVMWLQRNWPASTAGYWITASVLGLIWAYLVRFCAVALQSVQSGYARLPSSLDDSAATLGVSGFRLLRIVHIPLLTRSISAAALLVFVDVMKELPATLVLRPFNTDTLAVVAYQLARDERLGEAALPSLALVCVGLIPVLMLSRGLRHKT